MLEEATQSVCSKLRPLNNEIYFIITITLIATCIHYVHNIDCHDWVREMSDYSRFSVKVYTL